jgi:hypothetical protein
MGHNASGNLICTCDIQNIWEGAVPIFFTKPNIAAFARLADEKKLIQALKYNDSSVQVEAAEALGKLGARNAVKPLDSLTNKTESPRVILACIRALAAIDDPQVVLLFHKLLERRLPILEKPAFLGDDKSVPLYTIINTLGKFADSNSAAVLINIYHKTNDHLVRRMITATLGEINSPLAKEFLLEMLTAKPIDPQPFNNESNLSVMTAMQRFANDQMVQAVINGFNNVNYEIIECAPWNRKTSIFSRQMSVFENMLQAAWDKLSIETLTMIAEMKDFEDHYIYPETKVPGDDGWGSRDDETVPEEVHKKKINCSAYREKAKWELMRRQSINK